MGRTVLNTELLDREPSRPVSRVLLLDTLTPLLDNLLSPSLPLLMSLVLPRTLLTLLPFPLQPSPLPQHLFLMDLPLLTLLSSRESLLQSEPTPESLPASQTLSLKSMSRNTMLMSPLPSHVPFPVRSLSTRKSQGLMRSPFPVPSQSQLPTRFTPSRRSLRPPMSTTPHTRPTPPRLL